MCAPRRVAVITGSRAEYGLLRTVIRHLQEHPDIEPQVIVAGMHLLKGFGYTVQDVVHDGVDIAARVPMHRGGDDLGEQPEALSRGIMGMSCALQRLNSEIVVVLGDRIEALAGALAAVTAGRCVAHIHGGDVAPGHLDDTMRHAVTKLAHVHFAASEAAARRVVRLGEDPDHVHVVGAPGLDDLRELAPGDADWLRERFELSSSREVAVVLQHPIGRSPAVEYAVMRRILGATSGLELACVVLHPSCDPGHSGIVTAIEEAAESSERPCLVSVPSLPREEFLRTLMAAAVLAGNSSCGVIEAHTAGTPALNIGVRQQGRQFNRRSVVHCGESAAEIRDGLQEALGLPLRPHGRSVYGTGQAGQAVARHLGELTVSDNLLRKTIQY